MQQLSEHRIKKIKELESEENKRGSKKKIVLDFYNKNKNLTINEISKQLDISYAIVRYTVLEAQGKLKKPTPKSNNTLNKIFKSNISDVVQDEGKKDNAVDSFCPCCSKPVIARITAVELHKENYINRIIGTCKHCKSNFSYLKG